MDSTVYSNISFDLTMAICIYNYTAWAIVYILLIPLFTFVLYVGYKQRRKQQSGSSVSSHSDVFTFNMAVMEIIGVVGTCFVCFSAYTFNFSLMAVGESISYIMMSGQILFHHLTCLERYLAVVHPVVYLRLKNNSGVRNISAVSVWLISFGMIGIRATVDYNLVSSLFLVVLSVAFTPFLCASVLCVLIRPGPGEGGKKQLDPSKRRAFLTMVAITGALLLRFIIVLVCYVTFLFEVLNEGQVCLLFVCSQWLNIPSSLVLPILFLHRAGKLPKC